MLDGHFVFAIAGRQRGATEIRHQRHRTAFAVRVDRRVRHFRKGLLAVFKQRRMEHREDRQHAVEAHARQRFLFQLRHVLHEHRTLEVPPSRLQQVIERPVLFDEHRTDDVFDLPREVEAFGNYHLPNVQIVNVAEFFLGFGDDAIHDLSAIEPRAGLGVQGDHFAGLQLAAGDDGQRVQAEHARLRTDVQPAAFVRTPTHGA